MEAGFEDVVNESSFDFALYFSQLLNVFDDDLASIALKFFPTDKSHVTQAISNNLKGAVTSPWSYW